MAMVMIIIVVTAFVALFTPYSVLFNRDLITDYNDTRLVTFLR